MVPCEKTVLFFGRSELDTDDEVRDRATFYHHVLEERQKALNSAYILNGELPLRLQVGSNCYLLWNLFSASQGLVGGGAFLSLGVGPSFEYWRYRRTHTCKKRTPKCHAQNPQCSLFLHPPRVHMEEMLIWGIPWKNALVRKTSSYRDATLPLFKGIPIFSTPA